MLICILGIGVGETQVIQIKKQTTCLGQQQVQHTAPRGPSGQAQDRGVLMRHKPWERSDPGCGWARPWLHSPPQPGWGNGSKSTSTVTLVRPIPHLQKAHPRLSSVPSTLGQETARWQGDINHNTRTPEPIVSHSYFLLYISILLLIIQNDVIFLTINSRKKISNANILWALHYLWGKKGLT